MVEISLSGSGEGPSRATTRPTLQRPFGAAPPAAHPPSAPRRWPPLAHPSARAAGAARCTALRGKVRHPLVLHRRRKMGEESASGGPGGNLGMGDFGRLREA
jgi:hypothetical protein